MRPEIENDEVVMTLVAAALQRAPEEREAYLRGACRDSGASFESIWQHVCWEERMGNFLLEPLIPARQLSHPFHPGDILCERFQVVREVAQGGMGVVYEALDQKLDRRIALKCARPGYRGRLPPEARNAREISHRNVCKLHDIHTCRTEYGEVDFLSMEFLEGETLAECIRRDGPLPEKQVREIVRQVLAGLDAAHSKGVVHGDLKSNNVLLTKETTGAPRAVITDFGLARPVDGMGLAEPASGSGASTRGGALDYMAPELLKGRRASTAADVYAFGVILHEMLLGSRPESAGRLAPGLPRRWKRVISRCLQPEPAKRFSTARQVLDSIDKRRRLWAGAALLPLFLFLLIQVGIQLGRRQSQALAPERSSIVVLPFANLSSDPNEEYFSDGFTEEIINALAQVEGLRVISSTSAFAFKKKAASLKEIGAKLNVEMVLEGSVRKSGDQLGVTARLINASNEQYIWSRNFDEVKMTDIFATRDKIASSIAEVLKLKVTTTTWTKRSTGNIEGYQLYLHAYFYNRITQDGLKKSIQYFQQAVDRDPQYAVAYAGIAEATMALTWLRGLVPTEGLARAKQAATKAVELDPNLGEGHAALARAMALEWKWTGAEKEFRRAIQLNPSYATAHRSYALLLYIVGRPEEGWHELQRTLEVDPLSAIARRDVGLFHYYMAGRYDEAIAQFQRALEMDRGMDIAHSWVAKAYTQKGMREEAMAELQKMTDLSIRDPYLAYAYAVFGDRTEALRTLDAYLDRPENFPSILVPEVYAALGDKDRAFEYLERGVVQHWPTISLIKMEPSLSQLRSDPRFGALLKKMGLSN